MYSLIYLLLIAAVLFSIWAQFNVTHTFNKYSKTLNTSRLTGYAAARAILDKNGLYDIQIERVQGNLTDHYDPRKKVIRLSETVYSSPTPAAVGVAAHEAGHAVQYAVGYAPIHLRSVVLPVCSIGSKLAYPLIALGFILSFFLSTDIGYQIAMLGVVGYGLIAFFQFVTLPVEFNASKRAITSLQSACYMSEEETAASRKVLTAAALTYVAAFAVSLLEFLRFFVMVSGRRSSD